MKKFYLSILAIFLVSPSFAEEITIPLNLDDSCTPLVLVWIPPGTAVVGNPNPQRHQLDWPRHEVEMDGFWIGKYEITQAQFSAVMGYNPSERYNHPTGHILLNPNRPVSILSWIEAMDFCDHLSDLIPNRSFTLPNEYQWEYACRAGTTTVYFWGNDLFYRGFGKVSFPVVSFFS